MAHPTGHEIWHNFSIGPHIKKFDFLEVLNGNCSKKSLKDISMGFTT